MTLKDLEIGQSAKVIKVGGAGALRQHFLDMGIIPGAVVTLVKYAPMGDPMELRIHGYELTLRKDDAAIEALALGTASKKNVEDFDAAGSAAAALSSANAYTDAALTWGTITE